MHVHHLRANNYNAARGVLKEAFERSYIIFENLCFLVYNLVFLSASERFTILYGSSNR